MKAGQARRLVLVAVLAAGIALAGCGPRASGPPPIAKGSLCANCGMRIEDLRFACERDVGGRWKAYDSIECLIEGMRRAPGGRAYLADYDSHSLHAADSLWVVKGSFPSPMGGGYAAFLARAAADSVAAATTSPGSPPARVARLGDFMSAAGGAP